jgi:hypothetical protein
MSEDFVKTLPWIYICSAERPDAETEIRKSRDGSKTTTNLSPLLAQNSCPGSSLWQNQTRRLFAEIEGFPVFIMNFQTVE